MKVKSKHVLMIGIASAAILLALYLLITIKDHWTAKVVWIVACILDIIITYSTIKNDKGKEETELFSKRGAVLCAAGAVIMSIILIIILYLR